jgi:hypothetical protein
LARSGINDPTAAVESSRSFLGPRSSDWVWPTAGSRFPREERKKQTLDEREREPVAAPDWTPSLLTTQRRQARMGAKRLI